MNSFTSYVGVKKVTDPCSPDSNPSGNNLTNTDTSERSSSGQSSVSSVITGTCSNTNVRTAKKFYSEPDGWPMSRHVEIVVKHSTMVFGVNRMY